jgi:hypothetical protein
VRQGQVDLAFVERGALRPVERDERWRWQGGCARDISGSFRRPLARHFPETSRSARAGPGRCRDRLMAERVAVLGTGIMGAPMARNL